MEIRGYSGKMLNKCSYSVFPCVTYVVFPESHRIIIVIISSQDDKLMSNY